MLNNNNNNNKMKMVNTMSRKRFLASTTTAIASGSCSLFGTNVLAGLAFVTANSPEECDATTMTPFDNNPRYIERELAMTWGGEGNINPRSRGMLVKRITGDGTPYKFPVSPIRLVQDWEEEVPFKPEDFARSDSNDDGWFYKVPRLVYHIDEPAVVSLTQYYRNNIPPKSNILDICSSWVSHYPLEFPSTMNKIYATGMSSLELQFNDQLSKNGFVQQDLNVDPTLSSYEDNFFDVITCVVSIDYLIEPIKVLKECHRVLKPGGKVIISQSNRCFPSKAIAMWLSMNDRQHLELINGYFQYAGGFEPRKAYDISATLPDNGYRDPMFIVEAVKEK